MDMLRLTLASLVIQPGLDDEQDALEQAFIDDQDNIRRFLEGKDDDAVRDTDYYEQLKAEAEDLAGFVEKLGPVEHEERLDLMKASFGIPSEPQHTHKFHALPECTRDKRHVGDRVWHNYYYMSGLLESKLSDVPGQVQVYGIVATGGFLRLLSPRRGMSMKFNCLIEVDIRVKAIEDDDTEDKTLADGCMELIEGRVVLETLCRCTLSGPYGSVAFDYIIFESGFEATIELDFLEVPEGGFSMQMCGYTSAQKNYYAFIDKNCDCDNVVSSTGRFPQYFVAAVQKDDYFLVDFAEGKSPLILKPSIHGSEAKEYSFHNGALVSVKVSWSTAFHC
nr:unnamed protein product [Digitaria exilis]